MPDTATAPAEAAPPPVRFVCYLRPDALLRIPPGALVADWPAEDTCVSVRAFLESLADPDERDLLTAEVRDFAAEVAMVIRRELFPEGDALDYAYLGLGGGYQLVSVHEGVKVRVDQQLNVAIIRQRPEAPEAGKPRLLTLRQELLRLLSTPLASPDRKPVKARAVIELAEVEPDAVFAVIDGPVGSGFANGNYSGLRIYSDGKVTLLGFTPTGADANAFVQGGRPGTADESDPAFRAFDDAPPPPPGSPGTGKPPAPGSPLWTEEDQQRADRNRATAAALGGGAGGKGAGGGGGEGGASEGGRGGQAAGAAPGGEAAGGGRAARGGGAGEGEAGPEGAGARKGGGAAKAGERAAAGGADAAGGAGADARGEAGAGGGGASAGPGGAPPGATLRLDKDGELADDKVDMGAWDAGKYD